MIYFDNYDAFSTRGELAIPIRIYLTRDGEKTVSYTRESDLTLAKELDLLDGDELFSEDTKKKIADHYDALCGSLGYSPEFAVSTYFQIKSRERLNKSFILESSEVLMPDNGYENLTEFEPEPGYEDLLCFGTVIDGKLVSVASENPGMIEDDDHRDIAVETAEGYEGMGYGTSNVAALTYYLLDPGITVTYTVSDDNIRSKRIAEKLGFEPAARELCFLCYRD